MRYLEDLIQIGIVNELRKIPDLIVFAIPNQGRSGYEGAKLKRMGVLPGASDLIILYKGKTYFCEVKTPKGVQSEVQAEFQRKVEAQGFEYRLIHNIKEVKEWLQV